MKHILGENSMKKLVMILIITGMLIGGGGCTAIAVNALTHAAPLILAATILNPDLDAPVEYKGGAWIMEPNMPKPYIEEE